MFYVTHMYMYRLTSTSLLLFTVLISAISGIIVNPGDVLREGNCAGSIDAYLCKCLASNTTIDIQLSSGYYNLSQQPLCTLWNKTSITITGSPSNDTIIKCINGFSIKFYNTQNIAIRNLVMIGCGNVAFTGDKPFIIGQYLFYFDGIGNVSIDHLYLSNTAGYSIIISNYYGTSENIKLSDIHIGNTINDDCDYDNDTADYSCSGSGIFIIYDNQINEKCNISTIKIDNCSFVNNNNTLPPVKYNEFLGVANTGHRGNNQFPLVGAACISILDVQYNLNVTTEISNTLFYNNSGTFSASIALVVADSTKSKVVIENCTFDSNRGINKSSSGNDSTTGGIYFINLGRLSMNKNTIGVEAEVLTVIRSNFMNLTGTLGVAFHIEKNSPDSVLVIVKIEQCTFTSNVGDSGSAIFAKDRSSSLSYRPLVGGSLNIYLTNINADYNIPSSNISKITNNFITGIFHISNCLVILTCDEHCRFQHNQPSVFYGHRSALTINGSVSFMNNTAIYGGAIRLLDTVLYISTNTTAHFVNNFAIVNGGAIKVEFAVTNIQSQDNCPIQFVGLPPQLTIIDSNYTEINTSMDIDVLFYGNHARNRSNDLESIFANVFYVCSWYPDTSVLTTQLGPNSNVTESGFRNAVYREAFNYYGNDSILNNINNHLNISAIVPCVCDDAKNFRHNVVKCLENKSIPFPEKVIPGRPFVINITSLDTVGSVGYSSQLVSNAYNVTSGRKFALNDHEFQTAQEFSVGDQGCVEVDFTIYVHTKNESLLNQTKGNLTLSVAIPRFITIPFDFVEKCPTGFVLNGTVNEQYACMCNAFLTQVSNQGFSCNQTSGLIRPIRERSWLAVDNDDIQYVEFCSPTLCDYNMNDIQLNLSATNNGDVLCTKNHTGRACGDCHDGYSRVFGSDSCEECSNVWLITILMYAVLGVILLVVLFLLKLTVTVGAINGLVFFCNMMSINEKLFFNENISNFSFIRLFISIFNLDLGFKICFCDEMTQVVKTGLQFVFPVYLWPLIIIIVYLSRWSHHFQMRVSRTSVPVFATLILLSYAKLLRTAISVFSFVHIKSSMRDTVRAWRPDPSVGYLEEGHIVLFVIAVLFLLFIFPFAICFTYPKILHYKKFSFLFPFFDAFVAPYKEKYRFWFGLRALVLIYLAMMETIIFENIEALLLSSITVVGAFTIVQAYICPFKSSFINILDLIFTSIFLLMSSVVLYLNPTSNGYEESDIVVNCLGSVAFLLFCVVVVYQIRYVSKKYSWYINTLEKFWKKMHNHKERKLINTFFSLSTIHKKVYLDRYHSMEDVEILQEDRFQESLYEQM